MEQIFNTVKTIAIAAVTVTCLATWWICCSDSAVPCIDGDESCGQLCSKNTDCGPGLYCTSGKCAKACNNDGDCPEDEMKCDAHGRCISSSSGTGSGDPGGSDTDFFDDTGKDTNAIGDDICAETQVQAKPTTPTVVLIIDQSASMDDNFEGRNSRWDVLRDFLLEQPGGLISDLQGQIRFGLAMYSAQEQNQQCPMVTIVDPDLNNYQSIAAEYRAADTIYDTPTGDSINTIIERLNYDEGLEQGADPVIFVLATDGMPDCCEQLNPNDPNPQGEREAIRAVENSRDLGIRTYVIWIGPMNDQSVENHIQAVANAGAGTQNADYYVTENDAALSQALTSIVTGQLTCEIQLQGSVAEEDACLGTVVLNGDELECNSENGFVWVGPSLIRLQGDACDALSEGGNINLDVSFPCTVEIGPTV